MRFCGTAAEYIQPWFCPHVFPSPTQPMLCSLNRIFGLCSLQTPLHLSVYLEQHSVVEVLVLQGVKTALQDRNGNTPLHLACEQQSLKCAQLLLQEPVPGKSLGARRTQQDLQLQNWQGEEKQRSVLFLVNVGFSVCLVATSWVVFFSRPDLPTYQHPERELAAHGVAGEEWS